MCTEFDSGEVVGQAQNVVGNGHVVAMFYQSFKSKCSLCGIDSSFEE